MAGYRTDQCRLRHRGGEFHFVSYEGQEANPVRGQAETPAMWYLMRSGRRYAVMPQVAGQEETERDRLLLEWVDANVFGVLAGEPRVTAQRRPA